MTAFTVIKLITIVWSPAQLSGPAILKTDTSSLIRAQPSPLSRLGGRGERLQALGSHPSSTTHQLCNPEPVT